MNKEQIEKLKQMLSSKDLDDINLAGTMIKEQLLKISDNDLKVFWQLIDTLNANPSKPKFGFELLRDLLRADVHQVEYESLNTWTTQPYIPNVPYTYTTITGDCTIPGSGTLLISDGTSLMGDSATI